VDAEFVIYHLLLSVGFGRRGEGKGENGDSLPVLALLTTPGTTPSTPLTLSSTLTLTLGSLLLTSLLRSLSPWTLLTLTLALLLRCSRSNLTELSSIFLLLPALNDDLLGSATLHRDPNPTLTAVLSPQRSDDGLSSGLDGLVLDKRTCLGLYEIDLCNFTVLAHGAGKGGFGNGRSGISLLPVVQLFAVRESILLVSRGQYIHATRCLP
jgi:hypothetical protein